MVSNLMPTRGSKVRTSDGDNVGEVKEVRGSLFKVNAAMQSDYWLRTTDIRSTTGGEVLLAFSKEDLGDHKADEPSA